MSALPSHPARLNFRLTGDQKALIEQAAAFTGQSLTDFALASLLRAAHDAIQAQSTTVLSRRDGEAFLKMLESNEGPNDALKKAAARYKASRA